MNITLTAQGIAIKKLIRLLGYRPKSVFACTGDIESCPVEECMICSVRDCPGDEPLHYHHDGCPYCMEMADFYSDPHEREAARARGNDFEDTDGKDWT